MAVVAAMMVYSNYVPGQGTRWALLILPALPVAAWGAAHLAKLRGYPPGAGYGLFIFGFFVSGFLAGTHSPVTIGFAFVFVTLLPPVVLMGLPKKPHRFRGED